MCTTCGLQIGVISDDRKSCPKRSCPCLLSKTYSVPAKLCLSQPVKAPGNPVVLRAL